MYTLTVENESDATRVVVGIGQYNAPISPYGEDDI